MHSYGVMAFGLHDHVRSSYLVTLSLIRIGIAITQKKLVGINGLVLVVERA